MALSSWHPHIRRASKNAVKEKKFSDLNLSKRNVAQSLDKIEFFCQWKETIPPPVSTLDVARIGIRHIILGRNERDPAEAHARVPSEKEPR
jgi:hypothetical protein